VGKGGAGRSPAGGAQETAEAAEGWRSCNEEGGREACDKEKE
jgi:hypothetical protein